MNYLSLDNCTNKELIETLLKQIEENTGFHIVTKDYMDSYFGCPVNEKDRICHFRIREIPGFLFALWHTSLVNMPYENLAPNSELIFFTQYERDIDKFKPSRSGFVIGLFRHKYIDNKLTEGDEQREIWNTYELEDALQYMHKHPIKSYNYVQAQIQNVWEEISCWEAFWSFVYDWVCDKKFKLIKQIKLVQQKFAIRGLAKKLKCTHIFAFDRNGCLYPSLSVNVRRNASVVETEYEYDTDLLNKFEYKWGHLIDLMYWEIDIKNLTTAKDIEKDLDLEIRYELFKLHMRNEGDYRVIIDK